MSFRIVLMDSMIKVTLCDIFVLKNESKLGYGQKGHTR